MIKRLDEFKVGDSGTVVKITAQGSIKRRLYDMGLTMGVGITLHKLAPLGDPMEITLRSYELTLRKADAANVLLEVEG